MPGPKVGKRVGSLERLKKPRDGQISKVEEKVLESGSGQGPVLGARTVRDLAVCRAEKEQQVLLHDVAALRREGKGMIRAKGSRRVRAVTPPIPSSHQSLLGTGLGTGSGTTW